MATVITVHGTYAHIVGPPDAPAPAELQWWQPGSVCEQNVRQLVQAEDGNLNFMQFTWSGDNSEQGRRKAGSELLAMLRPLEERKDSYCLVGHSHGGSVIASALVESVAKGQPLEGLKKWITVGTPFVALRKERFLFSRLTLPRKVVLVASLMLLMMFLFYLGGQLYDGSLFGRRQGQVLRLAFSGAMMSVPFLFFYIVLKVLDARSYHTLLNFMTRHEITRSALGNDTEGEIALGADSRPPWMSLAYPFLPSELAAKISDYSNQISFQSLAKFRNAISTLAFSVDEEGNEGILATYLTWRELIHTAYFDVPEFRKLLAFAIGQADGFSEAEAFKADPAYEYTARWYGTLQLLPAS